MCPPQSNGVIHTNGTNGTDVSATHVKIDEQPSHPAADAQSAVQSSRPRMTQQGPGPRYSDFLSNTSNFKSE